MFEYRFYIIIYYHEDKQRNNRTENGKFGNKVENRMSRTRLYLDSIYKRLFYLLCFRKWCVVYLVTTAGSRRNRLHAICCTDVTAE